MKLSLLPVVRNVMLPSTLALLMATPFNDAQAERRRGERPQNRRDAGSGHHRRTAPMPGYHTARAGAQMYEQQINQYLYQGQRLDLVRLLQLRRELSSGKQLYTVQVAAQSTQHRTSLKLIMNGQTVGSLPIGPVMQYYNFVLPLNSYVNDLQLAVVGGAYVQTASAELGFQAPPMPPQNPNAQRERLVVDHLQTYMGQNIIPVRRVISGQYPGALRGKQLKKVVLVAESTGRRSATAQLLINGMPVGPLQLIGGARTRLQFQLDGYNRNIVGEDIRTVQIQLSGRVQTRKVIAVTASSSTHLGNAVVNVNRRFLGSQRISMSQLIGYNPSVNMLANVESVTIVSSGHGTISLDARGLSQGSVRVMGGTGTTSIRVRDLASLNEMGLLINGRVRIEQLRINYGSGHGRHY